VTQIDPAIVSHEDQLWHELWSTITAFTPEQVVLPGYYQEGWSAKDMLAHVGAWLAEGGLALERLHGGAQAELPAGEIDRMNEGFLTAMRNVSLGDVKTQAVSARQRMLTAWIEVPSQEEAAAAWIRKAGPDHYALHLPRLKDWLDEVQVG
jgi:hypothetical protein